jgi:malonyl CoA-acyl carrier protein transacylase/acyl carrier protein
MNTTSLVFLFPGQGAYFPGALHAAAQQYPAVDNTLQEIDLVCRAHFKGSVRDLLVDPAGPSLEALQRRDPNMLQMAIYAASVCAYRVLEARGCEPSMLVGHSFGEIAALVCAGAFSVPQGAEIIAARSLALKPAAGSGYMAAMGASPRRCAAIIELLETPQANVAVDNGPNQTVMSGAGAAMDRVAGVAQALGITFARLASPYPFHSAQLVPVAKAFRTAISRQDRQPSRFPTYSPILERVYDDKDDLATALSSHLVRPVRFAATIRHLRQTSDSLVFVEIGASNALIKLVQRILSDPSIPAFATLAPPSAQADSLDATLAELRSRGLLKPQIERALLQSLLPQPCTEAELDAFWDACGARILAKVAEEFGAFRGAVPGIPVLVQAIDVPVPKPKTELPVALSDAPTATVSEPVDATPAVPSRSELQTEIVTLYARAMAYPPEVFTEDIQLEAQLGIDAAKQLKLLHALETHYRLPPKPQNFRLCDLGTVGKVTDFVLRTMAVRARQPVSDSNAAASTESSAASSSDDGPPRGPRSAGRRPERRHRAREGEQATRGLPRNNVTPLLREASTPEDVIAREVLYREIVAVFAQGTNYAVDVFSEDAGLEAELGIDSVKQMELLSRLEARYRLPRRPGTFRMDDYDTLRKITDFIHHAIIADAVHIEEHITAVPLPTVAPAFVPSESDIERERTARLAASASNLHARLTRDVLQTEIVALFAEAMHYPPEVFSEDAELDAELGIDSVKQMELLSTLAVRYQLPPRPDGFRLSEYGTLRKITDFLQDALSGSSVQAAHRAPIYAVG